MSYGLTPYMKQHLKILSKSRLDSILMDREGDRHLGWRSILVIVTTPFNGRIALFTV
jgi:hypothetical protein